MSNSSAALRQMPPSSPGIDARIADLLKRMTLAEKIGQLRQVDASAEPVPQPLLDDIAAGRVGALINRADRDSCNRLQRHAVEASRLGIPLLFGRDVIHGFRTIFPIPLGLAASWNPALVEASARVAAEECRGEGVTWTFAPMVDISRDPRWGRIAEGFGEDPFLTTTLGVAMVRGFQGDSLEGSTAVAACAKHFVGYGASEAGRDYNTTNIAPAELANVHLVPFRGLVEAGVASVMTSFSDLDGLPATANGPLLDALLRRDWGFDGLVVSDWNAVDELRTHGLCENPADAAREAALAGIDMEMAGATFGDHLEALVASGAVSVARLDAMVANVLRMKLRLGLFEQPYAGVQGARQPGDDAALALAREAAVQSFVLLKNHDGLLPLQAEGLGSVAVIGPLADAPYEQLGTWVFDADPAMSRTPLAAIRALAGDRFAVRHAEGLTFSRQQDTSGFEAAVQAASASDVALVFLGEESILSGEAHSRAQIDLPGAQSALLAALKATGTPVVGVIMAGRPLTLEADLPNLDALVYAWHPGTMAGPALADVLFGLAEPGGRLPVTFPRAVGQIPIYHSIKNSGRPATDAEMVLIDDIPVGARQTSLGMSSFHLDLGKEPLFPFGHGLGYTTMALDGLTLDSDRLAAGGRITVRCRVTNTGQRRGVDVVQLYVRDLVGSLTRPVRELKGFQRVELEPGETRMVQFAVTPDMLAFHRRDGSWGVEPGRFRLWVAQRAVGGLEAEFELTA